jgi:acetylornithine deacetylase/succinyl-diaminopimelate desuccinylase-like protein
MLASAPGTAHLALGPLLEHPGVKRGLEVFSGETAWITDQQIQITEIPAPPFGEAPRAEHIRQVFRVLGYEAQLDSAGNVVAERPGSDPNRVILVSAHLDTVFPPGTVVTVRREGARLFAPGIGDNGAGLAALIAVARALQASEIHTRATIVLAANTGEEGEGNLRGISKLVERYRSRLRYALVIDNASADTITTKALPSRRLEVSVTGPGGHSWSDFGMPNPIQALSRAVVHFATYQPPASPRTTYNIGEIHGGTSVNSVPHSASMKADIRSESDAEIEKVVAVLQDAVRRGVEEESAAAARQGGRKNVMLEAHFRVLGARPGGELPEDSCLLRTLQAVDELLGNRARLQRSSTDANLALSLGIESVAVGGGGRSGQSHSPAEWYDPAGRELGLKRIFLTVLALAEIEK